MANNAAAFIAKAKSQVGYHEGKSGSTWNNQQKFSPEVPGLEWSQGQAWCATFVSWVAVKTGLTKYIPITASTDAMSKWFQDRGQWSEYPAVGAFGFLAQNGDEYHVFTVERYDDTYVYTIEGNTNDNGSSQGDGVYELKRIRRSASIEGYGYPAYPEGLDSADPHYKKPAVKKAVAATPAKPGAKKERPANVKKAIASFKQLQKNAKANHNLKKANKAAAQIKQIRNNWPKS